MFASYCSDFQEHLAGSYDFHLSGIFSVDSFPNDYSPISFPYNVN
jgi:hypothetical protein